MIFESNVASKYTLVTLCRWISKTLVISAKIVHVYKCMFCQLTLVDYQWLIYASAKCDISGLIISIVGFIDFKNLVVQKNDKYHPYAVVYVHMNESILRNMLCYK